MHTAKQYEDVHQQIRARLDELSALDLERDLIRKQDLGEQFSFEHCRFLLVPLLDLVRLARSMSLDLLPWSHLQGINNRVQELANVLQSIRTLGGNPENVVTQRREIQRQLTAVYDNLYQALTPVLLSNALAGTTQEDLKGQAKAVLIEVEGIRAEARTGLDQLLAEAQATLAKQREAAAETGATRHATLFSKEATEHEVLANRWLGAIYVTLALTVACGIGLLFLQLEQLTGKAGASNMAHVQFTITKVVLIAACFYALALAARNYKAHRHNVVVNKHRQNALQTFETFVKASTDEQTRNAVLLEAARTIYGNQSTGYLAPGTDADNPSRVIEIFKSAERVNH